MSLHEKVKDDVPEQKAIIVEFKPGDPENPRNWPEWRKWCIVAAITLVDLSVSWGASGFSPATTKFEKSFNVSAEVDVLGLSLYVLGLAMGPMTLAPLSEYFGRTLLYVVPYGIFLLFLLGTALVTNLGGFLVLRILSGMFASVTIANFGGTIADMWPRHEVGPPMSVFLWAAVCGSPSGYFLMSFVAQTRGWRDVFWALLGICGGSWVILTTVLVPFKNETRHGTLLRRRAARLRRERPSERDIINVPDSMKAKSVSELFRTTLTRPFRFLATEAIIICCALYNGYLYGLSFLFNGAFSLVFGPKGYGFSTIGVGLTFLGLIIGVCIGPVVNIWQERYYQRRIRQDLGQSVDTAVEACKEEDVFKNIPEARVQLGKVAAVTLPISLWWFAWTTPPDALAGIGLVRNLAGGTFPLFGNQMFENEGYNWAGTILACLAMLLIPIPFVLEKYGTGLRARSPWARDHMD
ncbi:hypothetical protein M409DRAFT_62035 [Zasmidium cellare ATCC 36951]|uniref:Major facilitator superfamily (MFS) profile domain-containing protein n=1 Tax=Zasmidium cellare ATCC 36951 TaxID=1080233 RepID=A0A6A6D6H2_ZASCE|nr:uncharacterized protein M409DRAFT_62035 [Zasmidium cellare ATCC 36951]KAF2173759.1 hypothetical protein M409DRAFT_62035 [Zasmidium cellare ATCC 36951]